MNRQGPFPKPLQDKRKQVVLAIPLGISKNLLYMAMVALFIVGSNWITYKYAGSAKVDLGSIASSLQMGEDLYLLDEAALFVPDKLDFGRKVKEIGRMLDVPADWLMAVMYAESKFDATIANLKGSGAVGLIQFMPATAAELNVSTERLKRMDPVQQLEYVYLYLQRVRERSGDFGSLTDLYLGILMPGARGQDDCYTLFSKPSHAYEQNLGLDENKDGRVTVSDIDRRMLRLFPAAYTKGTALASVKEGWKP